jgi:hypothetical protein
MARWRGRSRDWVERKYADYQLTKRRRQRRVHPKPKPPTHVHGIPVIRKQSDWKKVDHMVARKSAGRAAGRGAVYGAHALALGARIGTRAIPVVGWAMFAYDAYQLASYLHDRTTATPQSFAYSPNCTTELNHHDYLQGYYDPINPWRTM